MNSKALENTKKSKITIIILVLFTLLLVLCGIISLKIYSGTNKVQAYFDGISQTSSIYYEVSNQFAINKKLEDIKTNSSYTLTNAYTELNPYQISPLSGIIIFQTKTPEQIRLYINDEYVTTMEESKYHMIPVYGLRDNFDNTVRVEGKSESQDYSFKTSDSKMEYPLQIEKKVQATKDIYFTIASYKTHLTGWDTDGNLRFYLTENNSMDVEFLSNGHFLIGTPQGNNREQYIGFVEMDFLGKIYNYYTLKNGYSFEFQVLSNGNYMVPGGDVPVYFKHQMVTEINPENGNVVSSLDIYDTVKKIDPDYNDKYLGPEVTRNGFYYDEKTGDIVLSFREADTIWCINYKEAKVKWVLTSPDNPLFKNPVWKDYLITTDSGRYPLGQHSPQITPEGHLLYFNNGYDRYRVKEKLISDNVLDYKNAYTSVEELEIDEKTHTAKTVYNFDNNKKWFSIKYGYSRKLEDNTYLMNFGYILKDKFRSTSNSLKESEKGPDNIYTEIVLTDSNSNILFQAKSEEGKYRSFKHQLYDELTSNTEVSKLNMHNTIPDSELTQSNYKNINLSNSSEWINTLDFTRNTFKTDYNFTDKDSIQLYLVNKAGKVYILNYKDSNDKNINKIFNINVPIGDYVLFINVNGTIYNTKKVYTWK